MQLYLGGYYEILKIDNEKGTIELKPSLSFRTDYDNLKNNVEIKEETNAETQEWSFILNDDSK